MEPETQADQHNPQSHQQQQGLAGALHHVEPDHPANVAARPITDASNDPRIIAAADEVERLTARQRHLLATLAMPAADTADKTIRIQKRNEEKQRRAEVESELESQFREDAIGQLQADLTNLETAIAALNNDPDTQTDRAKRRQLSTKNAELKELTQLIAKLQDPQAYREQQMAELRTQIAEALLFAERSASNPAMKDRHTEAVDRARNFQRTLKRLERQAPYASNTDEPRAPKKSKLGQLQERAEASAIAAKEARQKASNAVEEKNPWAKMYGKTAARLEETAEKLAKELADKLEKEQSSAKAQPVKRIKAKAPEKDTEQGLTPEEKKLAAVTRDLAMAQAALAALTHAVNHPPAPKPTPTPAPVKPEGTSDFPLLMPEEDKTLLTAKPTTQVIEVAAQVQAPRAAKRGLKSLKDVDTGTPAEQRYTLAEQVYLKNQQAQLAAQLALPEPTAEEKQKSWEERSIRDTYNPSAERQR